MGAMVLRNYGDGVTGYEYDPNATDPLTSLVNGGAMTQQMKDAWLSQFGTPYADVGGHTVNYGEGVTGTEGATSYNPSGKYGPNVSGDSAAGNNYWNGSKWVPIPDAGGGSLFSQWAGDILGFAAAASGAYGLAAGLGGLAGAAGAAGAADIPLGTVLVNGVPEAVGGAGGLGLAQGSAGALAAATPFAAALGGGSAALGGGGMDELIQQYVQAGYTPEQAQYFAQSDLVNQGLYNAGNYSGAMTTTGLLPEVIAPGASIPSSLLSQAKSLLSTGKDVASVASMLGLTSSDLTKALGSIGSSALGYLGSTAQTNALNAQADKYSAMGAPYRDKLASLYADPSKFLSDPSVTTSVDQGTNSLMRSLSTQGNPWGSGNALQQGQDYATKGLYGQLGAEKDRLAGFGGLTQYNAAAPQASTNAIASSGNAYNAIGSGIGNIFNPPQTAAQQMTALAQAMKGVNPSTGM